MRRHSLGTSAVMAAKTAVIVLKSQPNSPFRVIPDFHLLEFAQGCREAGFHVEYLTAKQPDSALKAAKLLRSGECAFFFGHGFDTREFYEGDIWAFAAHNVPCGFFLEAAWNGYLNLTKRCPGQIIFHLDPVYGRIYQPAVPDPAYHALGPVWGLTLDSVTGLPNDPPPYDPATRDIDVLFIGHTRSAYTNQKRADLSEPLFKLAATLADIGTDRIKGTIFDLCIGALWINNIQNVEPYSHAFFQFVYIVDVLSRERRRAKVLDLLSPFNVHVISDTTQRKPGFTYYNSMAWPELEHLIDRSKVVINVMTNQPQAIHERIVNSMARGACVFTQTNDKICETFKDGQDLVYYDLAEENELPEKLRWYFANPAKLKAVADQGRERVRRDFNYRFATDIFLKGLART
jgi:hypothetical protein